MEKENLIEQQQELLAIQEMKKTKGAELFREYIVKEAVKNLTEILQLRSLEWDDKRAMILIMRLQSLVTILKKYDGIDEQEQEIQEMLKEFIER